MDLHDESPCQLRIKSSTGLRVSEIRRILDETPPANDPEYQQELTIKCHHSVALEPELIRLIRENRLCVREDGLFEYRHDENGHPRDKLVWHPRGSSVGQPSNGHVIYWSPPLADPKPSVTVHPVIDQKFIGRYPVNRVIPEAAADEDVVIQNITGETSLTVKSSNTTLHSERAVLDAKDAPLAKLQGKMKMGVHLQGGTLKKYDFEGTMKVRVSLEKNGSSDDIDLKFIGSRSAKCCTMFMGDSSTPVAQIYNSCTKGQGSVTIWPNVDHALVSALIVLVGDMKIGEHVSCPHSRGDEAPGDEAPPVRQHTRDNAHVSSSPPGANDSLTGHRRDKPEACQLGRVLPLQGNLVCPTVKAQPFDKQYIHDKSPLSDVGCTSQPSNVHVYCSPHGDRTKPPVTDHPVIDQEFIGRDPVNRGIPEAAAAEDVVKFIIEKSSNGAYVVSEAKPGGRVFKISSCDSILHRKLKLSDDDNRRVAMLYFHNTKDQCDGYIYSGLIKKKEFSISKDHNELHVNLLNDSSGDNCYYKVTENRTDESCIIYKGNSSTKVAQTYPHEGNKFMLKIDRDEDLSRMLSMIVAVGAMHSPGKLSAAADRAANLFTNFAGGAAFGVGKVLIDGGSCLGGS